MSVFTEEQAERFIEHLICCHSWYKHLPVLTGFEFILVVDPDAGRNYHRRLLFGDTQEAYQKAFGLLNYYWGDDEGFWSDCKDNIENSINEYFTREEICARFPRHVSIRLFPYIAWEFEDMLRGVKENDVDPIAKGYKHENGEALLKLKNAITEVDDFWQTMSEEEQDECCDDESTGKTTPKQIRYKELNETVTEILGKLREGEIAKIRQAVFKLQAMPEK